MALPKAHIDWTRLSDREPIELVGRVYVATLPAGHKARRAVVIWSGHDAAEAQRWLDKRVRATSHGSAARNSRGRFTRGR